MSNPRSFRLDDLTIKKLEKIQKHLQERLDHIADMSFVNAEKATATKSLEFAINLAYQKLEEEGVFE